MLDNYTGQPINVTWISYYFLPGNVCCLTSRLAGKIDSMRNRSNSFKIDGNIKGNIVTALLYNYVFIALLELG